MLTFKSMKRLAQREEGKLRARKNFQRHISPKERSCLGHAKLCSAGKEKNPKQAFPRPLQRADKQISP